MTQYQSTVRGCPQIHLVFYSGYYSLENPLFLSPIATSLKWYDIPLGRLITVCHFLFSKETHYYEVSCYTSTLLANKRTYFRSANSHIKVKLVLTNHKRELPALKNRFINMMATHYNLFSLTHLNKYADHFNQGFTCPNQSKC